MRKILGAKLLTAWIIFFVVFAIWDYAFSNTIHKFLTSIYYLSWGMGWAYYGTGEKV